MVHVPTLAESLEEIRNSTLGELQEQVLRLSLTDQLPTEYLDGLKDAERTTGICLKASLLCYCVTAGGCCSWKYTFT